MYNRNVLVAKAAVLLLAACGGESAETANGADTEVAGPAEASNGAESPVTREALIGTWGQSNCTNTMGFAADGTATSSSAEQADNRWSLDGSTIVITSPGEEDIRMPATLKNGELHLNGGGGEGQSTVLTRCETDEDAGSGEADDEAAE
jgi:hypothetical protein